jgi:hypothetical protein
MQMMENRTEKILKRLAFLGYREFEIRRILQEASNGGAFFSTLEKYEQLGSRYLTMYSK